MKKFKRLLLLVAIAGVFTFLVRSYVLEGVYIASSSMEPTLQVKTSYFLEKITLLFTPPRRGDIVVFPSPIEPEKDLVKRVIAVGGDKLQLKNKQVFLNGQLLEERYVEHTRSGETLEGDIVGPMEIPPGTVFVMGDNRDESGDSRDWLDGKTKEHMYFVPVENIKGRLILFF